MPKSVVIIPTSHLDLFWLGDYRNCLRRGDKIIREYLDRCVESGDETFVIDTVIFAEHFINNNPEYLPIVRQLLKEGRLEIGTAYIDRGENLVLGESLIRNIQIGRKWNRDTVGIESRLAAHPDLPGLNAQTAQIYVQAGIEYYITSRKIFQEGRIWRHRSPDGTALIFLTWPMHYMMAPMDDGDIPEGLKGNFIAGRTFSRDDLDGRYPFGTVPIAGSAGDLTGPNDFVEWFGYDVRHFVDTYRDRYPETTWGFAVPGTVIAPYLANPDTTLEEVHGSIPSVWGVAASEGMRFLHQLRELEHCLLSAETAGVLARLRGKNALPPEASSWSGLYGEYQYFADRDTPPEGYEWEWLWRMHVFTQDHNSGGQDGVLSTFAKKVRHDRSREYTNQVIAHAFGKDQGSNGVGILRTRLGASESLVIVDGEEASAISSLADPRVSNSTQAIVGADGVAQLAVSLEPSTGVGYSPLILADRSTVTDAAVKVSSDSINVQNKFMSLTTDRVTGETTITDLLRGQTWSGIAPNVNVVPEIGTDVSITTDEGAREISTTTSVDVVSEGPLCTQIRIVRKLLDVTWVNMLTVWNDESRVDLDLHVQWPGFSKWQIRMPLVKSISRESIMFGTPFHAQRWDQIPVQVNDGYAPDEANPEAYAQYREVQHWLHLRGANAGMTIATRHPAFRNDGQNLDAVLMRTPVSCGDNRLYWSNPGSNGWHFELNLTDAVWDTAKAPERGDISWRRPVIRAGVSPEKVLMLANNGENVQLSACFAGSDGSITARLVNQSDRTCEVRLAGEAVGATSELMDLDENVTSRIDSSSGECVVMMRPWQIQTVRLHP